MTSDNNTQALLAERFSRLPKVVQDAILSADVEKHMRTLAAKHQLHFDQWTRLENEVMFALLGLQPVTDLASNIEKQVGIPHEIAINLADSISKIVFAPIRAEMEKLTTPPQHKGEVGEIRNPPAVPVGTPPQKPLEGKAVRTQISETYVVGHPSSARKSIDGDPYREPIV